MLAGIYCTAQELCRYFSIYPVILRRLEETGAISRDIEVGKRRYFDRVSTFQKLKELGYKCKEDDKGETRAELLVSFASLVGKYGMDDFKACFSSYKKGGMDAGLNMECFCTFLLYASRSHSKDVILSCETVVDVLGAPKFNGNTTE